MAPRIGRRLAAILAADVAGYSRLMGEDEAGTHTRLTARRKELIEPLVAEHCGRVVKLTGDGVLVEFASAVDAVECAVAIQKGMAEREADQHEDRRLRLRIGINIGDIILQEGDIYGDGVNVAARLEPSAWRSMGCDGTGRAPARCRKFAGDALVDAHRRRSCGSRVRRRDLVLPARRAAAKGPAGNRGAAVRQPERGRGHGAARGRGSPRTSSPTSRAFTTST